jgi:hypothetical protein
MRMMIERRQADRRAADRRDIDRRHRDRRDQNLPTINVRNPSSFSPAWGRSRRPVVDDYA